MNVTLYFPDGTKKFHKFPCAPIVNDLVMYNTISYRVAVRTFQYTNIGHDYEFTMSVILELP